jgi:hypothetical protein
LWGAAAHHPVVDVYIHENYFVCWIIGEVSSVWGKSFTVCLHGFYMGFSVVTVGLGVWIVYARCRVSGEREKGRQVLVGVGVRWDSGERACALISRIGSGGERNERRAVG